MEWKRLRNSDGSKFPLEDNKEYKVRMIVSIDENENDFYAELNCIWNKSFQIWIRKETYELFDWIDMDDVQV